MSLIEPKPTTCSHCDFGSGHRGMDRCHVCDGTGSVFWAAGAVFPNTETGYRAAVLRLNDAGQEGLRDGFRDNFRALSKDGLGTG